MSAEATGWVFRESPYTGVMFALHLAVADTVNDVYHNEFWMSAPRLADKARMSERSVRSGLAKMVRDGLLEVVAEKPGTTRRYQFQMPPNPCTSCTPAMAAPLQSSAQTPAIQRGTPAIQRGTPAVGAPNPKRTQEIPSGTQDLSVISPPSAFDEFWKCYPVKRAKDAARKAFDKARKRAPVEVIIAGALRYAEDPGRDPDFTKHPATWLNAGCWDDEPTVDQPRLSRSTRAIAAWAERTS